jgi:hypothetical protein
MELELGHVLRILTQEDLYYLFESWLFAFVYIYMPNKLECGRREEKGGLVLGYVGERVELRCYGWDGGCNYGVV